jgi:septum formation inhibitor MinC
MTDTKMSNLEIFTKRLERELAEAKSNLAIAQLDYDTFAEEEDHEAMAELRQEISELVKLVEELEEELAVANDNDDLDDILKEMNMTKVYTIKRVSLSTGAERTQTGTLAELIDAYSYTLKSGKAYERERGNAKINMSPKTVESLVTNLNRAINNSSSLGSANGFYELVV